MNVQATSVSASALGWAAFGSRMSLVSCVRWAASNAFDCEPSTARGRSARASQPVAPALPFASFAFAFLTNSFV